MRSTTETANTTAGVRKRPATPPLRMCGNDQQSANDSKSCCLASRCSHAFLAIQVSFIIMHQFAMVKTMREPAVSGMSRPSIPVSLATISNKKTGNKRRFGRMARYVCSSARPQDAKVFDHAGSTLQPRRNVKRLEVKLQSYFCASPGSIAAIVLHSCLSSGIIVAVPLHTEIDSSGVSLGLCQ